MYMLDEIDYISKKVKYIFSNYFKYDINIFCKTMQEHSMLYFLTKIKKETIINDESISRLNFIIYNEMLDINKYIVSSLSFVSSFFIFLNKYIDVLNDDLIDVQDKTEYESVFDKELLSLSIDDMYMPYSTKYMEYDIT